MLSNTVVFAGQVTVPNTFTSGTSALASEVNSNFSAVETAVNDNATAITALQNAPSSSTSVNPGLSVYDNGVRIGAALGMTMSDGDVTILSETGYIEIYSVVIYNTAPIYFASAGCIGTMFVLADLAVENGFVQKTTNSAPLDKVFSIPGQSVMVAVTSVLDGDKCNEIPMPFDLNVRSVLANDPAVTGLQNTFTGPITIAF